MGFVILSRSEGSLLNAKADSSLRLRVTIRREMTFIRDFGITLGCSFGRLDSDACVMFTMALIVKLARIHYTWRLHLMKGET